MKKALMGTFTIAALLSVQAGSATAATESANASAEIVSAISISKVADLNFGQIVLNAGTGGSVTISNAGVRTSTGDFTFPNGSSVSAASFTVTGATDATYSITLPGTASLTSGANSMTVDTFTSNPGGTGTLTGGTQTLNVGAKLTIGAAQAQGAYTGTFDVVVAYN